MYAQILIKEMKKLLKQYFGYDKFRPKQENIILNVLKGRDVFVLMPTGGGKSLCYQLPALKMSGITLVISPLVALMKDQVDSLRACGVTAEFINSTLSIKNINEICERAKRKEVKILYCAPERFALTDFQNFLQTLDINLIAVDEAHCISEWGHDFRPDYRNLSSLKQLFSSVPIIALTATATEKVQKDILNQLNLKDPYISVSGFNRKNLNISVIDKKKALPKLINLLDKYRGDSVIIYCFSRKETEKITETLKLNGFSAIAYHAGLDSLTRKNAQNLFTTDNVNIIVATIAFGMGIDKPDVRLVVHFTYPRTLEGYYQEIGRAGRDGLPSECVMFYTYADTRKHEFFINQMNSEAKNIAEEKLRQVLDYAETMICRKKYLLKYFGEELEGNCGSCDICLNKNESFDATIISQKILSAVIRTGNKFGRTYIVNVLLGKRIQQVLRNSHDRLSVFGIVDDFSDEELSKIINNLVGLGYIIKSNDNYPTLSISKQGIEFLEGKESINLQKPKIKVIKNKKIKDLDYNVDLFEILRAFRKELAEKDNIPPFVIFGDTALQEMSYYFPLDKKEFLKITGVGELKLNKFGDIFLEKISKFVEENDILPIENKNTKIKVNSNDDVVKYKYYQKTKVLIDKKTSIERIARNQNLKIDTIINHIEKLSDSGVKLDLDYLKLPKSEFEIMKKAFLEIGDQALKPVFESLNGKFSYDKLKLVRVILRY